MGKKLFGATINFDTIFLLKSVFGDHVQVKIDEEKLSFSQSKHLLKKHFTTEEIERAEQILNENLRSFQNRSYNSNNEQKQAYIVYAIKLLEKAQLISYDNKTPVFSAKISENKSLLFKIKRKMLINLTSYEQDRLAQEKLAQMVTLFKIAIPYCKNRLNFLTDDLIKRDTERKREKKRLENSMKKFIKIIKIAKIAKLEGMIYLKEFYPVFSYIHARKN